MSPQFRATSISSDHAPFTKTGYDPSVIAIAPATNNQDAHGNTKSTNSSLPANSPFYQASKQVASLALKRSYSRISSSTDWQPLPSSHGSALPSCVLAGNACPWNSLLQLGPRDAREKVASTASSGSEPRDNKARTPALISSRQPKSHVSLVSLVGEVASEAAPPSAKICHDPVRQVQDTAFPTLPHFPTTVSSSSFPDPSCSMTEGGADVDGEDSPSFGWFVSTDVDETDTLNQSETFVAATFLPDSIPDLAFKMTTAPSAEDQEIVVQQALAADTIDDVLGDLF